MIEKIRDRILCDREARERLWSLSLSSMVIPKFHSVVTMGERNAWKESVSPEWTPEVPLSPNMLEKQTVTLHVPEFAPRPQPGQCRVGDENLQVIRIALDNVGESRA